MTRQAIQLGFLPRMTVRFTSARESGQIYMPAVNWLLLAGVLVRVLGFGSSSALAGAYGIAVTLTMADHHRAHLLRGAPCRWQLPAPAGDGAPRLFFLVAMDIVPGGRLCREVHGRRLVPAGAGRDCCSLADEHLARAVAQLADGQPAPRRPGPAALRRLELAEHRPAACAPHGRVRGGRPVAACAAGPAAQPEAQPSAARKQRGADRALFANKPVGGCRPTVLQLAGPGPGLLARHASHYGFMETPDVPQALSSALRRLGLPISSRSTTTYFLSRESRGAHTGQPAWHAGANKCSQP